MVNWVYYSHLLDEKIADAWYNWEHAERKEREARTVYEAAMREKESFENALDEMVGEIKHTKGESL